MCMSAVFTTTHQSVSPVTESVSQSVRQTDRQTDRQTVSQAVDQSFELVRVNKKEKISFGRANIVKRSVLT